MLFKEIIIAGCGGFIGTAGRYLVGKWTAGVWSGAFPLATFLVNVTGCFIVGLLFGFLEHSKVLSPSANLLLITGFCGGFTTFSSFSNDVWVLGSKGDWVTFGLYIGLSIVLGVLCVWAGRAIIR